MPSNSSAPISKVKAPPLTEPTGPGLNWLSISLLTPGIICPCDSNNVPIVPVLICRLIESTNVGTSANEFLSLLVANWWSSKVLYFVPFTYATFDSGVPSVA